MINVAFIVNHPTQFEVPFYQFVQKNYPGHRLDVFYLANNQGAQHFDDELGYKIKWGFDLYEGYHYEMIGGEGRLDVFKKALSSKKYDLVIINGYKNQFEGFAQICREKNIPVALRLDNVLFNQSWLKIQLRKILLKSLYSGYDHFLVTGRAGRAYLHKMGIPDGQINIFTYCTDNSLFNSIPPGLVDQLDDARNKFAPGNETLILSVAKFMDRESPWDIIRAFAILNDPGLALVLVGDGEEKEKLIAFTEQYPHLKIHFPGYVPYLSLPIYYHIASVFVHAAKDEPWGVSVQEAIAGGCSVVCSNKVGAAQDMVLEGQNGATYEYGHPGQLAEKLSSVLKIDKEKIKKTNETVLQYWNYPTMWNELLEAVKKTAKKVMAK